MFHLTRQERLALLFCLCVFVFGWMISFAQKKYPALSKPLLLQESYPLIPPININHADYDELLRIPYVGKSTAAKIIRWREESHSITHLNQLQKELRMSTRQWQRVKHRLKI